MALTKSNAAPAANTPPAPAPMAPTTSVGSFETMDETTSSQPASNDAISGDAAPAAAPASTAVAVKPAGAVVTSNKAEATAFQKEVEAMKGAADFRYGNFKVFKGNNGDIMETGGGSAKLGRWVKVSMLAWDDHTEISPGSKSDKSKEAVAYSKDGITVDSIIGSQFSEFVGKSVDDYVQYLKTDGDYPDAKKSRFIDIACIVHEADSEDTFNGEVIQVTLSQSSIPSFASYQETLVMKAKAAARGIPGVKIPEDPFTFYFLREVTTKGDNTWTKLKVLQELPKKF